MCVISTGTKRIQGTHGWEYLVFKSSPPDNHFGGGPGGCLVFGLASLTSLMSHCSALLTCSFHAFLLLLTNFTTTCKLNRSRMSTFFILSNLVPQPIFFYCYKIKICYYSRELFSISWSQWTSCLKCVSASACFLGLRVRIPPGARTSLSF